MPYSFENQKLDLSAPFVYSDGLHASANFYPHELRSSAVLKFVMKDGEVIPTNITYSTEELNDGKKISIEIASNGFIIKSEGKTHIAEGEYDMKSKIEELAIEKNDYEFAYEEDVQIFINMAETIELIQDALTERAAAA